MPAFSSALPCVPSLYVRIYHSEPIRCRAFSGSLTIREGISSWKIMNVNLITFPHYTWGYIAYTTASWRTKRVPSLYVRVYHPRPPLVYVRGCSLTIREGISTLTPGNCFCSQFPHYTWGYIGRGMSDQREGIRSLTIREGISFCLQFVSDCLLFPHYTWGYITRLIRCKPVWRVPSLYVRVYHWV